VAVAAVEKTGHQRRSGLQVEGTRSSIGADLNRSERLGFTLQAMSRRGSCGRTPWSTQVARRAALRMCPESTTPIKTLPRLPYPIACGLRSSPAREAPEIRSSGHSPGLSDGRTA